MRTLILTMLTLMLTSCSTLDRVNDTSKDIIDYLGEKTDEITTDTLDKVESTISTAVDTLINSEGVAFLVVVATLLSSFVVLTSIYLLVGSARAGWKRWVAK